MVERVEEGANGRTPIEDELSSLLGDAHSIAVAHSGLEKDAHTVREFVWRWWHDKGQNSRLS